MGQARFFVARAAHLKTGTLVERLRTGLGVQHHLVVATLGCGLHQGVQHLPPQAPTAQRTVHGHAPNARDAGGKRHQPTRGHGLV